MIMIVAAVVEDEVARSLIPGKRLSYLARDPFRRRMSCDVDVVSCLCSIGSVGESNTEQHTRNWKLPLPQANGEAASAVQSTQPRVRASRRANARA